MEYLGQPGFLHTLHVSEMTVFLDNVRQEYDPGLAMKTLGEGPATATGTAEADNRQLLVELVGAAPTFEIFSIMH